MKSKRLHLLYSSFGLLCLIFIPSVVFAQDEGFNCSQHIVTAKLYEEHPELKKQHQAYNEYLIKASKSILAEKKSGEKLIIPVVFHVVHNDGPENVSYEQIQDAVTTMNEEFNARNADVVNTDPEFKDVVGVADIEFRLATKDPNGNCTNGVNRYFDTRTNSAGDQIKVNRQWPANKYLNIYTVNRIASGAAGYAYFPGASPEIDGIIIIHSYIGRIGTGDDRRSSALTHEVGHYLALYHVWGEGNNPGMPNNCLSDDDVEDTPNCAGTGQCNLNLNSCGQGTPGDKKDNVQNYMEYAYCYTMFTKGQVARMRAALTSAVGGRSNLWNPLNLAVTGANYDGEPTAICQANFQTKTSAAICQGGAVTFEDKSFFNPTSWNWTFEGGTPSSSTEQNPTVVFQNSGDYKVSLEVSNSTGTVSAAKPNFIKVFPGSAQPLPYQQDFNTLNTLEPEFSVIDFNSDYRWEKVDFAGFQSDYSVGLYNNYVLAANRKDELITKTFDLQQVLNPILSFRYAFAAKQNSNTDQMVISISNDCGVTYKTLKTLRSTELRTAALNANEDFVPSGDGEWKSLTLSLKAYKQTGTRIKFTWTSGGGNNVYLDNINILEDPNNIENLNLVANELFVYPNPNNGQFELNFSLLQDSKVTVELIDLLGKVAVSYPSANYPKGQQTVSLKTEGLTAGMYNVKVTANGTSAFKKVIIQ